MQFTTQQLQGGPKYSHKTRIGNWNEDLELSKIQKDNYQAKKAGEKLPFAKTLSKYQSSYRQVPWSYSPTGELRWNDQIMISNSQTEGWLVMDIGDKVPNVEEAYQVTSTGSGQNPGPMTRSVFQLTRVDEQDIFGSDQFIRYGQKLRFEANQYLFRKKLSLYSYKQTGMICSPVSNKQLVSVSAGRQDYNSVWVIDHIDPNIRFEMQGEIVKAGDPVLIRHFQTNVYLGSDKNQKYKNDFGTENEVHGYNHSTLNKSQNLALEKDGKLTVDVPTKFQQDKNVFFIQTAPEEQYSRSIEELTKFDIGELIKDIKGKLSQKSKFGIKALERIFKAIDEKSEKNLEVEDFRWGLLDYGIQISKDDALEVLQRYDVDKCGLINFPKFIDSLIGNFNSRREEVTKKAFDKLDQSKSGHVKLDDIAQAFDASQNPDVVTEKKSEQEVYLEFMSLWNTQIKEANVSYQEFKDYHKQISGLIDDDDQFVAYVSSAFRI